MGQSAAGEARERNEALRGDSVTGDPFADAVIRSGRNLIGVLGILWLLSGCDFVVAADDGVCRGPIGDP